ncbi:hypothetical protein KGF56_004554 [Candida oxycetoniae]|uniref:Sugar phosphate transporter domain-containing protein n=1 Tax=Candida oxycetoniae TaxID=497107 RepID=A0AAI9STT1_9ASCO|nr:uncharacterized protein KGF56_004554 [Candida oxycetoniae]KAI3402673.2 hypothetical protein KGF56_004554 [Candida oxycetoniae]
MNEITSPVSIKVVLTCLLWYTVSSITSQLTKLILVKFTYPLFLSQCQFVLGATLAFSVLVISKYFPSFANQFPPGSLPESGQQSIPIISLRVLLKIFPLGLFQFTGKFFSLSATSLIPLPTISSIKALSPLLIVIGYRTIYRVEFPVVTYFSLAPLLFGVILIIISDSVRNNNPASLTQLLDSNEQKHNDELDAKQVKGIALCLLSTVVFAAQNIYGKQLITWGNDGQPRNPVSLVLNTNPVPPSTPVSAFNVEKSPQLLFSNTKSNLNNANTMSKFLYARQRNNSIKLPYSTSDLTLDEMKESFHLASAPSPSTQQQQQNLSPSYAATVSQNNTNIYNPFAYFIYKFELDKIAKPDKMTIVFYCSLIGSFFSIGGFVMNELPKMYLQFNTDLSLNQPVSSTSSSYGLVTILMLILLNSLSHFLQTLLAFHLLGSMPALSYSIASVLKRIVLITVSIVFTLGYADGSNGRHWQRITTEQMIGLVSIATGLYCYDRWGSCSVNVNRQKG